MLSRGLVVLGSVFISFSLHAASFDCGEETKQAKKDCNDSMKLAQVNNEAIGFNGQKLAAVGSIYNGASVQSDASTKALGNVNTASESCTQSRKKAATACEDASRKAQEQPGTLAQIKDNWEGARDYIDNRRTSLGLSADSLSTDGIAGGNTVSSLSH